jgi:hypothetical protein
MMNVGTKSVLFGVHCFFIHPLFVLRAWWICYQSWPTWAEFCAICTHDLGYYGMPNMDGPEGETHPERIASWWRRSGSAFGNEVAAIVIGHSRFHAAKNGVPLSRLFRPDKLATALYPRWLYLIMANLSGEIDEYIGHCKDGKYANVHHMDKPTQIQWLIEIQAHMALMGLHGQNYGIVREQMAKEQGILEERRQSERRATNKHFEENDCDQG